MARSTNLADILASAGIIPPTFGRMIFCDYDNGRDGNDGLSKERAVKTVAKALTIARTNRDDVILLSSYGSHVLTSMLDVSKNRVHFVGMGAIGRHFGQRAKINLGVTTAATDIATVKITGVGCSFTNIKFTNANTVAEGIYCVADGGEYTVFKNCEIYKETDLDVTGAAELLANGDSSQFYNCTIGSTANEIVGAILRPCVLCTAVLAGKKLRDNYFENCLFLRKAGNTANRFVYGANATDVERMLMFKDCTFLNNKLSAASPAACVTFGAAQTEGSVLLKNCTSVDCAIMATAAVGIYVDGAVPTFGTSGVSVLS